MYHKSYCTCGGYILEQHNWIMIPYDDDINVGLQQYCPECGQLGLVMPMYKGELGNVLYNIDYHCVECYDCSYVCDEHLCSFEEYITEQLIQDIELECNSLSILMTVV